MIAIVPTENSLLDSSLGEAKSLELVFMLPGIGPIEKRDFVEKVKSEIEEAAAFLDRLYEMGLIQRQAQKDELIYLVTPDAAALLLEHLLQFVAFSRARRSM